FPGIVVIPRSPQQGGPDRGFFIAISRNGLSALVPDLEESTMAEPLLAARDSVITGWDFSTGAVKCLAFDLDGNTLAEVRLPTDLWTADGVSELNLMQLEGQARASIRAVVSQLHDCNRLNHWRAGGISATHHTA